MVKSVFSLAARRTIADEVVAKFGAVPVS
jgi:hypothetical protein